MNLTKTEYSILLIFYNANIILSKQDVLEKMPMLNPNSTAATISSLLKKGFLEVAEIRNTRTSLARAYRPTITLSNLFIKEYGYDIINSIVEKSISEITEYEKLDYLLKLIEMAKKNINIFFLQDS